LLNRSCVECHSGNKPNGDFRVERLDQILKGGQSGEPAIVRGHAADSPLIKFASDQVEDLEMPRKNRRSKFPALTPTEIQRLTEWINQGAL